MLLNKYPRLELDLGISERIHEIFGTPSTQPHDWVDLHLLSTVDSQAVHYLVSDDDRLLRKAARAGLSDVVLSVADGVALLRGLFDQQPPGLPLVQAVKAYELDLDDPIWASFRLDYSGFDIWIKNCRAEGREARAIRAVGASEYAGIAILKPEDALPSGRKGKTLKICSFKISERYSGRRYGELLLKSVLEYCALNRYEALHVEVLEKYGALIGFLEEFGFVDRGLKQSRTDEHHLEKMLVFTAEELNKLNPFEFHVRFGPPALAFEPERCFVVPIQPKYHRKLFPEFAQREQPQQALFSVDYPFGNSLRKAYLTRSGNRQLRSGDTLLFYRSTENQLIAIVGVVEDTVASKDPAVIATAVGNRTVYSLDEIEGMTKGREILAILFRQARMLDNPISYLELLEERAVLRAPQTICRIRPEGHEWVSHRLQ